LILSAARPSASADGGSHHPTYGSYNFGAASGALLRTVDLNIGESCNVKLSDGTSVAVKLAAFLIAAILAFVIVSLFTVRSVVESSSPDGIEHTGPASKVPGN